MGVIKRIVTIGEERNRSRSIMESDEEVRDRRKLSGTE